MNWTPNMMMLKSMVMKEKASKSGQRLYLMKHEMSFVQRCISDPLPLPSASVYSTMQLHAMIHEGHIDLNPPYQRGPLP